MMAIASITSEYLIAKYRGYLGIWHAQLSTWDCVQLLVFGGDSPSYIQFIVSLMKSIIKQSVYRHNFFQKKILICLVNQFSMMENKVGSVISLHENQ